MQLKLLQLWLCLAKKGIKFVSSNQSLLIFISNTETSEIMHVQCHTDDMRQKNSTGLKAKSPEVEYVAI